MTNAITAAIVGLFNLYSPNKLVPTDKVVPEVAAPLVGATTSEFTSGSGYDTGVFSYTFSYAVDSDRNLGFSIATDDYDMKVGYNNPWELIEDYVYIRFWPYLDLFYNISTLLDMYVVRLNLSWLFSLARTDFVNSAVKINVKDFNEVCTFADLTQVNFFLQVFGTIDINECAYSIYDVATTGSADLSCGWTSYAIEAPFFIDSLIPDEFGEITTPIMEETCYEDEFLPLYFKYLYSLDGLISIPEEGEMEEGEMEE